MSASTSPMNGLLHLSRIPPERRSHWRLGVCALILSVLAPAGLAGEEAPRFLLGRPPRLVIIKTDGLAPYMLAAVAFPENPDYLARLGYGVDLSRAIHYYQQQTGREVLLPNIRKYLFREGVFFENLFSETQTLSSASWAVIETGQPSVIKGFATFSRDNGYVRSYLDGLRDTWEYVGPADGRTPAMWMLDQVGVSPMFDAFDPARTWNSLNIFRRTANQDILVEGGRKWLFNDRNSASGVLRSHLSRLVTGLDYTEFSQELSGLMTVRRILDRDMEGAERNDYVSCMITIMDHAQHFDPHPDNLIRRLVTLDQLVGETFMAVEKSERREETVVAMVSDHGSEIQPGKVAYSFPVTRFFRTPEMGGHNVKTILAENAWNSLTSLPGIDIPRINESEHSPYGKARNPERGDSGYMTSYIDPFGNGRATIHLRNNDLNRLHLILLELKRQPQPPERWARLRQLFRKTLEETRRWLDPDLALMEDYQAGARGIAESLARQEDSHVQDIVWRLRQELERIQPTIEVLKRLQAIRFEDSGPGPHFDALFSRPFAIPAYLPRQYLGLANSPYQLSHYTLGLDEQLQWVETTVDWQGRRREMNYFEMLCDYEAANAPVNGIRNPFDLISASLPAEAAAAELRRLGLLSGATRLRQAVWLLSTAKNHPSRGGQALILQAENGHIQYLPIAGLQIHEAGALTVTPASEIDPLGLLHDRGFQPEDQLPALPWMRSWHSPREWLQATYRTEYTNAVPILADVFGDPVPGFVDEPEFRKSLAHLGSDELRQRYLRGLKRKYSSQQPDLIVWHSELWNFNSQARTSGGTHGGLRSMVTRCAFLLWGGAATGIAGGRTVAEPATTLDVVPTLFGALGMLDGNNTVLRDPRSVPERLMRRLPGRAHNIWESTPPLASVHRPLAIAGAPVQEQKAAASPAEKKRH